MNSFDILLHITSPHRGQSRPNLTDTTLGNLNTRYSLERIMGVAQERPSFVILQSTQITHKITDFNEKPATTMSVLVFYKRKMSSLK